ncbi:hypothetical protein TRICHSKD4_6123 [Roseibium sp. TrichSKD4]|nr:hypothetical protein TRICHSKD4_6123 [Roseibium sp. TrichSKD4]
MLGTNSASRDRVFDRVRIVLHHFDIGCSRAAFFGQRVRIERAADF